MDAYELESQSKSPLPHVHSGMSFYSRAWCDVLVCLSLLQIFDSIMKPSMRRLRTTCCMIGRDCSFIYEFFEHKKTDSVTPSYCLRREQHFLVRPSDYKYNYYTVVLIIILQSG